MFAPPWVSRPSCRSRQRRLGALFAIAFRNARSRSFSTSSRRRSVTSMPETSTSDSVRPVTSATGTAVQANARNVPSALRSSDSTSSDASPGRCRGDCSRGPAVVVLRDQIHERQPDELVVAPAERLPERSVRTDARVVEIAVADRPVAVEDDSDARDCLERSRCRVALALELELALPALGDVEAARDDADDAPRGVLHGCGAPVDASAPRLARS